MSTGTAGVTGGNGGKLGLAASVERSFRSVPFGLPRSSVVVSEKRGGRDVSTQLVVDYRRVERHLVAARCVHWSSETSSIRRISTN